MQKRKRGRPCKSDKPLRTPPPMPVWAERCTYEGTATHGVRVAADKDTFWRPAPGGPDGR